MHIVSIKRLYCNVCGQKPHCEKWPLCELLYPLIRLSAKFVTDTSPYTVAIL